MSSLFAYVPGERVEAYWNLHRDCLSFRAPGGRVQHATALHLRDVRLVVQPAGRERVLRERQKNVHAFVRGALISSDASPRLRGWRRARYNPYEAGFWMLASTGEPVFNAAEAVVRDGAVWLRGTGPAPSRTR